METSTLKNAADLARKVGHVVVATADSSGTPHVAAAAHVKVLPPGRLAVSAWFCPTTLANVAANHHVSVVVWDAAGDTGVQLLGEVEGIHDLAVMDGYAPGEAARPIPQVDRELVVRVDKAISFTRAAHTDVE